MLIHKKKIVFYLLNKKTFIYFFKKWWNQKLTQDKITLSSHKKIITQWYPLKIFDEFSHVHIGLSWHWPNCNLKLLMADLDRNNRTD